MMLTSTNQSGVTRASYLFTWSDDLVGRVLPSCRAIFDELAAHALGVADIAPRDKCLWIPRLSAFTANELYYGYMTAVDMLPAVELAGKRLCIPFFIAYSSRPMIDTHHTVVRVAPDALHQLAGKLREHLASSGSGDEHAEIVGALDALDSFAAHVDGVLGRLRAIPPARIEALTSMPLGEPVDDEPATPRSPRPALLFFC